MANNQKEDKTDISQLVMERIREENKWAVPVHERNQKVSKGFHFASSFIAILLLVGISISFIFISPVSQQSSKDVKKNSTHIVTIIKSTDFAKSTNSVDYTEIKKGMVASIGEPHIYQPHEHTMKKQTYWILIILGISMITLFMNWLSREDNSQN